MRKYILIFFLFLKCYFWFSWLFINKKFLLVMPCTEVEGQFQRSHAISDSQRTGEKWIDSCETQTNLQHWQKVWSFFLPLQKKKKIPNIFGKLWRELKGVEFPRFWNFTFSKILKLIALNDNFITQWIGNYQIWSVTADEEVGNWHARKWLLEFK